MQGNPLFTGLTRSAELAGIPVRFWLLGVIPPVLCFVFFGQNWLLLALHLPILCGLMFYLQKLDHYIFSIFYLKLYMTPRTRNRSFWGGNSYGS